MAEDPQPMTLQQRIAALNAAHMGRVPGDPPAQRPKPQIPLKRPVVIRQKTVNNPPEQLNGSITDTRVGNQPAAPRQLNILPPPTLVREDPRLSIPSKTPPPPLPKRNPSQPPPPLPIRQESADGSRRGSVDSIASAMTDASGVSATRTKSREDRGRIKAPAWGDTALPVLPPRGGAANSTQRKYSTERPKYVNRAPSCTPAISPGTTPPDEEPKPVRPSLPPRLPSRKSDLDLPVPQSTEQPVQNGNLPKDTPPMPSLATLEKFKRSALSFGLNKPQDPHEPTEPAATNVSHGVSEPPPIPLSSRPDLTAIQATKPRPASPRSSPTDNTPQSTVCLVCRDFAGPDHHASLFPRSQVSSLQSLAQQLTAPFSSPTDKARAIFTWLHLNIRYDVDSFFANNVRGSTPQSTLASGLAVCEGYAALFTSLATHAGLESIVISGHGKGFGHHSLAPGSPIPPFSSSHAWNAVKIDHSEWKLIDACWGAGHVQGKGLPYVQSFNPSMFSMSNTQFGLKHFPGNKDHFFLPGGRRPDWAEYIAPLELEPPTIFTNAQADYGIGERTVLPRTRRLSPSTSGTVRFQFGLLCAHWVVERHTKKGSPPVFILAVHGVDGRNKDHIALEHVRGPTLGAGGDYWYVDMPYKELGAPGQTITIFAITSFGDRKDARGLTVRQFREGKGRVGMAFCGIAAWDLV